MRMCAVFNCGSGDYQLYRWRKNICEVHGCNKGVAHCLCPAPFELFIFPKEKSLLLEWTKLVNRKAVDGGDWKPSSHHRICSKHFPDGRPTKENPLPNLEMGFKEMAQKCCVPNCRGNHRQTKEHAKENVRVFHFPSDSELCAKWVRMISSEGLEVGHNTVVCEKHFAPEFIIRANTVTRADGSILMVQRKNPKLAADAYPSLFLNSSSNPSSESYSTSQSLTRILDMAKPAKMPRGSDAPRRSDLELFMECEEEELTPSQRDANSKAQTDYKSALQKIEESRTVSVPRSVSVLVPPRPGPARKATTVAAMISSTMRAKKSASDDIIVIEDEPVTASRSPGKRGRPPTQTNVFAASTYSNIRIQSSPLLVQTLASTTSNLSLVSSNMSNMMPIAPRASSGMIFPPNTHSFLTLPTTLQSNSIGLTMGKKVLLAMPVSAAGGKQTLVLPAGIKQLQVINAMQSTNSIPGTQSMRVSDPLIFVTSSPKSTPTTPALTTKAGKTAMSTQSINAALSAKARTALATKAGNVALAPKAGNAVMTTKASNVVMTTKASNAVMTAKAGGNAALSTQSINAALSAKARTALSPKANNAALPTLVSSASVSPEPNLPRTRGRGRPRKVYAPCSDDDIEIVELLQATPPTPPPAKMKKSPKKIERQHSGGSSKAVSHLGSPVALTQSISAVRTVTRSPKCRGRAGRPRKIVVPSDDDEVQIVEPIAVKLQPVKPVRPAKRDEVQIVEPIAVKPVKPVRPAKRQSKSPASVAPAVVSGTFGLGVKRPKTSDDDALSSEAVQKKLRSALVVPRKSTRSAEASPAQTVVSGTSGIGIKRPNVSDEDTKSSESAQKKPRMTSVGRKKQNKTVEVANKPVLRVKKQDSTEESEEKSSTWIPLDEYYYGKKEGDPTYREDKGEYRFKCWYCHKMLYNNLRLMLHMQGHIDNDKQQNLDLSDLTQCRHCYKQFDTPFEMQCHIEKVHQNNSNVLVCRICEKDHENQSLLQQHMKSFHQACEMPYSCKLCNYRSSIFSDVVDHFKKRHDSSQYILCLYCLKIFKVSFYKTAGWGMTQNYYQHIQKHQNKGNNKKCVCCKLTFLTKQETDDHRTKDHVPNYRGIQSGRSSKKTVNRDKEQVLICMPEAPNVKLLNAPATSKVLEIRILRFQGVNKRHRCLECEKPMNTPYHYKNYVECTLCRFATSCNDTFASHMMVRHSGVESDVKTVSRKDGKMPKEMFCLCGFSTLFGSFMANHLVSCSKRTCYSSQPEMKYFEYDDEQEEFTPFEPYVEESEILRQESSSPDADVPSLFGVLGLVKKPRKYGQRHTKVAGSHSRPEVTADVVVNGIIEDLLDAIFPAEKAASDFISYLLEQVDKAIKPRGGRTRKKSQSVAALPSAGVDSIPPELTGPRKWKTVKISDSSTPSKKAIFLGSEADAKESTSVDADLSSPVDVTGTDDAPVIDPVVSETALLSPSKVRPHVCDGEDGDIFWNMPDIEKMESDDDDDGDLKGNEAKDTGGMEKDLNLTLTECDGVVKEEEHDEDDDEAEEDKIKIERDEEDSTAVNQLACSSEDLKQPENADSVAKEAEEEECDEDAISEATMKIEKVGEDSDLLIRLQLASETKDTSGLEVEMDLKPPRIVGVLEEAREEENDEKNEETILEDKIKMEKGQSSDGREEAKEEQRDENNEETILEDKAKIEKGQGSDWPLQLANTSEGVQVAAETKDASGGLKQEMDLKRPEIADGREEAKEEQHDENDGEAIFEDKAKIEKGQGDWQIQLVNASEGIKLAAETKDASRLELEMDSKQPEIADGREEAKEEEHGDDEATLEDEIEIEIDEDFDLPIESVCTSEDTKQQPENAGSVVVEEAEEAECDEEAISEDNTNVDYDGDSNLLVQLANTNEDVQLAITAAEVDSIVNKHVDSDGIDAENGKVIENGLEPVSCHPSVECHTGDALAVEPCVAGVEDVSGDEEHGLEMNSNAEVREVNPERGSKISLGLNIRGDECELGFPCDVNSTGGEVSMSPCSTDVAIGSLFHTQPEVTKYDLEAKVDVIGDVHNIHSDGYDLEFPQRMDSIGGETNMSGYPADIATGSLLDLHPEEGIIDETEAVLVTQSDSAAGFVEETEEAECDEEAISEDKNIANVDVELGGVQDVEELDCKVELPKCLNDLGQDQKENTIETNNSDMYNFDEQYEDGQYEYVGGEKCNTDRESDSINPDQVDDQEDLTIVHHKKCDYLLEVTEQDKCDIDQENRGIDHEENRDYQDATLVTDQEVCRTDKSENLVTEQELRSTDQDNHYDEENTAEIESFSHDDEDLKQNAEEVGSFSHDDDDLKQNTEGVGSFSHDDEVLKQDRAEVGSFSHDDEDLKEDATRVWSFSHDDEELKQDTAEVGSFSHDDEDLKEDTVGVGSFSHDDEELKQDTAEVASFSHDDEDLKEDTVGVGSFSHDDEELKQDTAEVASFSHDDEDLKQDRAEVGSFSHDNEDLKEDATGVGSFGHDDVCNNNEDVETGHSFHPNTRIAENREELKNEDTEQTTAGIGDDGCFIDQPDNDHAHHKDYLVADPCPSAGLQDILRNDKTLTSFRSKAESHDVKNSFNETDESNTVIPKLPEKESLGIDLPVAEKFMDTPDNLCLNENVNLASVKATEELEASARNDEGHRLEKSEIQDQHSQEKKTQDYSSSAGSEVKRVQGDSSSCTDRKESHSPRTSFPKSPPVSSSDKSSRRDSHHSDSSSHHNDRGYGSREDDNRRGYNQKDYNRWDPSQRDYDRRDYDRRDHDRRDYDRRDYDRRDYDRRQYDHGDQRSYDRSGSGYRYEGYSHGNRRDRDDRFERHGDSRSGGQSRNSGQSRGHYSSNSNRRPYNPPH